MSELKVIEIFKHLTEHPSSPDYPECDFHSFGKGPSTEKEIKELEKFIGHNLPEEHKSILLTFGSCTFDGKNDTITFFPINELINDIDKIEKWDKDMKNTSIIGADMGGQLYFYDLTNQTGWGLNSIFYCYPGNMSWANSLFLGNTLEEVIFDLINGVEFFETKPRGKKS